MRRGGQRPPAPPATYSRPMTPFDETATQPGPPPASPAPWDRIALAVTLMLVDPQGLRGLWLRARAGPLRDRVLQALAPLHPRKLHPNADDGALYGSLDLAMTLAQGHTMRSAGLLSTGGPLLLTMAERCPPGLAARLGQALDTPTPPLSLIALDEGAEAEETLPPALADRLGLFLSLDGLPWQDSAPITLAPGALSAARARLRGVTTPPEARDRLTRAAHELGIASARAPLLALACARAAAALRGHPHLTEADLTTAAELVYSHRAAPAMDSPPEDTPPPEPPPPGDTKTEDSADTQSDIPEDILVAAARAALPPDLLDRMALARLARGQQTRGTGAGAALRGKHRGRPLSARPGRPSDGARLDLVATLRNAAPWQPMRRAQLGTARDPKRLIILPSDLRIRRFEERAERALIFAVDASGSQAVARLAEVKGAVELLLASAYARRDNVALVTFRGTQAALDLPPTRSLVQAKRRLAGLPGGGGTPLALGLERAAEVAALARARGMTPVVALLTDGRANIGLDGQPGRAKAAEDARQMARALAQSGTRAVVIDTGLRPQPALNELARALQAECIALPRANAAQLSTALAAALDG